MSCTRLLELIPSICFLFYRSELDLTLERNAKELSDVQQSLNAYTSVGEEFENIVKEYTSVKEEIETKKWGLRELKHVMDSSLPGS